MNQNKFSENLQQYSACEMKDMFRGNVNTASAMVEGVGKRNNQEKKVYSTFLIS